MPEYDVVLRGGRVVDPESGLDAVQDVAVAGAEAEPLLLPSLGNGTVEKITSTGISKYPAIRSARYRLGLYSPRSRYPIVW